MLFVPYGRVQSVVNSIGQEIDVYNDSLTYMTLRAKIEAADATKQELFKVGVRPEVDLVAYVDESASVERGQLVVWNNTRYEVAAINDELSGVKRLLLQERKTGGVDLTQ